MQSHPLSSLFMHTGGLHVGGFSIVSYFQSSNFLISHQCKSCKELSDSLKTCAHSLHGKEPIHGYSQNSPRLPPNLIYVNLTSMQSQGNCTISAIHSSHNFLLQKALCVSCYTNLSCVQQDGSYAQFCVIHSDVIRHFTPT